MGCLNIDKLVERLKHLKTNEGYGQPESGLEFQHDYYGTYHLVLNPQQNGLFKTAIDTRAKDNELYNKGLTSEQLVDMLVMNTGNWTPYNEETLRHKKQEQFELFLNKHNLTLSNFQMAVDLYEQSIK